MKLDDALNLEDLRREAKRILPKLVFDHVEGGCDAEHCIVRNVEAFRDYTLLPRYLVDVGTLDLSVDLLGRTYAAPIGISPTGVAGLVRPGTDLMLAEAAAAANVPYLMSSASNGSLEDAARIAPNNTWFQMYATRRPDINEDLVRRARDAGVQALVVTVDVPVASNRERNRRNGFTRPLRMSASLVMDGLLHPAWVWRFALSGGIPVMQNWAPYAPPGASADDVADLYGTLTPAPMTTWADLDRIRALWPGKLVVKGILHPDDALRCANAGADGLIISNHGGRQLDVAPSPLTMLPAIRQAVPAHVELIFESGIRRGSDVLIALALGARFALFGRPPLYGVAVGGVAGASKVIAIMRREIQLVMTQIGCPAVAKLGPEWVKSAAPARHPS